MDNRLFLNFCYCEEGIALCGGNLRKYFALILKVRYGFQWVSNCLITNLGFIVGMVIYVSCTFIKQIMAVTLRNSNKLQ